MKAFITGSQIYGNPDEHSDTDLVIFGDDSIVNQVSLIADSVAPLKVGKLNIIVAKNEAEFLTWRHAKELCINKMKELDRSLTREEAVTLHEQGGVIYGVVFGCESGCNTKDNLLWTINSHLVK